MVTAVWETFQEWVLSLGYLGIFLAMMIEGIGLPFPGDATLAFFGYLSSSGHLLLPAAILTGSLGSTIGSLIAFALGKRYGLSLLTRYGKYLLLSVRSIDQTVRLSSRYGVLVLLFGRLFPGVRTLSSYIAGIGGMSWPIFLLFSFAGFVLFCSFWTLIGFWLGENWPVIVHLVKKYTLGIVIAGMILVGLYFLKHILHKR
ncbi:DedA family protein [Brevibacillus migulae]|uniref:DedA family protein n=1 Tax=Brevibacillus migulae TaxID=1644114 RepID=UPI00106DD50A|nr:DedA family protein [Brevibacillus migulae]